MNYTIRPIRPEDAEGINALRRMPGVFETILGNPAERTVRSREFIEHMGPGDYEFVAVVFTSEGETVIGTAGFTVASNPRLRHVGNVGIMVHRDYHNQGVGTALMSAVLDMADNWLMLVRLELTVFADNDSAIHLYEKLGFEKEGLRRMAAIRNGEYADEYGMARIRPEKGRPS